jgi:hypothetical protein
MTNDEIAARWTPNTWAFAQPDPETQNAKPLLAQKPQPRLTDAQRREKRNEYCRITRARRKAEGRCPRCGKASCKRHACITAERRAQSGQE